MRQRADPRAAVLAALGVVRGRGDHAARPVPRLRDRPVVQAIRTVPEGLRRSADLVKRDQPGVAVEERVLQSLGHDRSAELLETPEDLRAGRPALAIEHAAHEAKDVDERPARDIVRLREGGVEHGAIGRVGVVAHIGAIDRHRDEEFADGLLHPPARDVPRREIAASNA